MAPEEDCDSYRPGGFHPVHLGDIFHGRYKVLRKLGWGRYSTVWLARDNSCCCYRALKVLSAECYGTSKDLFEREILEQLRDSNPDHAGYRYIPSLIDSFEHVGPNGRHVCLVFEPMGETLASFVTLFAKFQVPNPIMQRFARQLLLALDYAHQSNAIHTDIKPRNIMVQIPDPSIIDEYLMNTPADPDSDPLSITSQPLRDFYIRESTDLMTLDIALCDWGSASWVDNHLSEIVQPVLLRAPEVIIGAPWGPPVDIWNLGAVLLEVLDAVRMFDGRMAQTGGVCRTHHHLDEMVALFGPFPPQLLAQGDQSLVGEYMDEHGQVRDSIPRPYAQLENWIESLAGKDLEEFISFLKAMMVIDPGKRKTAKQLLDEPWLQHQP